LDSVAEEKKRKKRLA